MENIQLRLKFGLNHPIIPLQDRDTVHNNPKYFRTMQAVLSWPSAPLSYF